MLTPMQFGYNVGLDLNQGIKSGGWFGSDDAYRKQPGIPESAAQRRGYSNSPSLIGSIGNVASGAVKGLGYVAQGVGNVAQGLGNVASGAIKGVGNVAAGISNGLGAAEAGVSDVLGNLGHGVWKGASDTTFTPMQFGYDVGMHAEQYMKSGSWLSQGVGNVAGNLGNLAQGVGNVAQGVGNAAASVGRGIGSGLASAGSYVANNPGTVAWEASKWIPGVGAIPSLVDAGTQAYKGNYLSALGHVAGAGLSAVGGGVLANSAKNVGGRLLASGAARMAGGATNTAAGTARGLFNTAAGGAQYAAGRTLQGAGRLTAAPGAYVDDAMASMNKAVGTQAQKVVGPAVNSGSTFKPMQAVKNQIATAPVSSALLPATIGLHMAAGAHAPVPLAAGT